MLREIGCSGRFAIVEAWRDKAAHDAHSAAMKTLSDELKPYVAATFDTRPLHTAIRRGASGDPTLQRAMYVLTHIDVTPSAKDDAATMIKDLSRTAAATRV